MNEMPSLDEIFGNFIPYKITPDTWVLNFMDGSENLYLLEGDEKALLMDTGWGSGNILPLVKHLTDKELIVVNTHFHPDHAGANGYFEQVYVSQHYKLDEPSVTGTFGPFDLSAMPYPNYQKLLLHDGDEIDLGNRVIKVYEAKPAHCNSSLFFYDRKQRMFFVGDEFEAGQVNLFDNSNNPDASYDIKDCLNNFKENALFIKSMLPEITYLLPCHNGTPISFHYLDAYIRLVDEIYAGTAVIEDQLNHKYLERDPKAATLCRVRCGDVSVFLNKELLMTQYAGGKYEKKEENITLARVFSDGMILQRQVPVRIFGTAKQDEKVDVLLNDTCIASVDIKAGAFSFSLPAQPAMTDATLVIGDKKFSRVDFGEVWVAGGQSNMEFPLSFDRDEDAKEIPADEHLRIYTVGQYAFPEERDMEYKSWRSWDKWISASEEQLKEASALSYFYGKELRAAGVPVGIINCSWGSTSASAWVNKDSLKEDSVLHVYTDEYEDLCSKLNRPVYDRVKQGMRAMMGSPEGMKKMEFLMKDTMPPNSAGSEGLPPLPPDMTTSFVDPAKLMMWGPGDQNAPGALYENMLPEIIGYTNKGFLWYQGESDDIHADMYDRMFALLIDTWRRDWKKAAPEIDRQPFIFVQLAPLGVWNISTGDAYPYLRECQERVAKTKADVYMVSNGDLGNVFDIHPKYKKEIARRAALLARKYVYEEEVWAEAPRFKKINRLEKGICIEFENALSLELKKQDEKTYNGFPRDMIPTPYIPPVLSEVNGLKVTVDGIELESAEILLSGEKLEIYSESMGRESQIQVEYAKTPFYRLNLYNEEGIPPFGFSAVLDS